MAQMGARGGTGSSAGAAGPSARAQLGGFVSAPREHMAQAQGWLLYWGAPYAVGGSSCSLQTMSQRQTSGNRGDHRESRDRMGTGHGTWTSGTRQCPLGPAAPLGSAGGFSCTGLSLRCQAGASRDAVPVPVPPCPARRGLEQGWDPAGTPRPRVTLEGAGGSHWGELRLESGVSGWGQRGGKAL